jgi:hypothetical protein
VDTSNIVEQLQTQLKKLSAEIRELHERHRVSLQNRRKELDEFTIVLFGRTMAGKSTLMEILTNGNGRSIGKGAQRTTRDVRAYRWRGLKITDVPGVAAFEGSEDEEEAFEAAATADLVLFLITDDSPQPVEAECFARLLAVGKSVLGICNIKVALDDEEDMFLFLRSPDKAFDRRRIDEIVDQFHRFAAQYAPCHRVQFVPTHLRARFLSRGAAHRSRRKVLDRASRFRRVERRIIAEVVGRGKFLRVKSFIDGASVPMLDLSERLLDFSAQNLSGESVLADKRRQAIAWREMRIPLELEHGFRPHLSSVSDGT